jgi:hypothetical protein
MKIFKLLLVCVAVLTVNVSFAQVDKTTLDMNDFDSTWTAVQKTDWNKAVKEAEGLYGNKINLDGILTEHFVKFVEITNIANSYEMVIDSVITRVDTTITGVDTTILNVYDVVSHPKYETQWLVYHNLNGDVVPALTYDNPFSLGTGLASVIELITTSGLHKGDDSVTNAKHPNDIRFAPKGKNNIDNTDDY